MNPDARQAAILDLLQQRGFIPSEELAERFRVSKQTIRRDLGALEKAGAIERGHGGAMHSDVTTSNTAYTERQSMQADEKMHIAAAVAEQIPDDSSLFINIGTTNEAIAKALLNHKGLRVITNNLNVALILCANRNIDIIIAGGKVRNMDAGVIGEATIDLVEQFRVDYGIIGISGIDDDGSLLDFDYQEVRVAQAIISNSRQVILAADHSKFGRQAMIKLGTLDDIHMLATDEQPPKRIEKLMAHHKVELLLPSV